MQKLRTPRLPTPINSRAHGMLDLASAALLVAAPRMLGWDRKVRRFTDLAALGTVAYAQLTDYETGAVPAMSMRSHLAVDMLEGATFLSAAYMMEDEPRPVRLALAGYGLFALAAGALTDRHAHHPRRTHREGGGTRMPSGAWVMDDSDERQEDRTMTMDRTPNRTGEADWRRSREETFDSNARRKAEVGRNAQPSQGGAVGQSEWRQAKDTGRPDMAKAGANTHQDSRTVGHDARRGYMGGQGI